MLITFPTKKLENFSIYAFYESAFSDEECEAIKKYFFDLKDGLVGSNEKNHSIRKAKVGSIKPSEESAWIYQKFFDFSKQCNDARWGFQLTGFGEEIQTIEYAENGSHYDWHTDIGEGFYSQRKLSLVLLLDKKNDYDGGELCFIGEKDIKKFDKGTLFVFPSYMAHKVNAVTNGTRRTIVAWVSGEPYR